MKYDLTARLFPLLFDKYAYSAFKQEGLAVSKKEIHKAYKAMVQRTPALPEKSPFTGNILMGCYALAFYKAYPNLVSEALFHKLVLALCHSKPMINSHKNEDAFDEKTLTQKEKDAAFSPCSKYEMDWQFTFQRKNNSYDLIYTKCGLCRLGRRENCFHLIKYLCEADYITYALMGADLKRECTIANGDSCCDFHVSRKEKTK